MTRLNQEIVALLPSLRRYARAVTGGRRTGDRYVCITLEILAEEPWRIGTGCDLKFHLYGLFDHVLSIFEPDPGRDGIDQSDPYHRLKRSVLDLPLKSRKLLLLVLLERFPLRRAAELLQMPAREAAVHLVYARARLSGLTAEIPERDGISQEQAA